MDKELVELKYSTDQRTVVIAEEALEQALKLGLYIAPNSHFLIRPIPGQTILNIGCRHDYIPGYVNIDKDPAWKVDMVYDARALHNYYKPEEIDGIVMTHCFVYLNAWEGPKFLEDTFTMLKPGAMIVLQHPDQEIMLHYIEAHRGDYERWLEATRGLHAFDYNDIKNHIPYPPASMSWPSWVLEKVLKDTGFDTTLIELCIPPERPSWRDNVLVGVKPGGKK